MVEAVGVLGNLSIPNLDFDRLFRQFRLVDWVKSKLTSGERGREGERSSVLSFPGFVMGSSFNPQMCVEESTSF